MAAPTGFKIGETTVMANTDIGLLERTTPGGAVGDLTIIDTDSDNEDYTFSIVDKDGNPATDAVFEIVKDTVSGIYSLAVKSGVTLNYEDPTQIYRAFWIKATDGTDTVSFRVGVELDNIPEAPTDVLLSAATIAEKSASGTIIGNLSALDPDKNDTFTYTLTNDAEGRFGIVDGKLVVKDGTKLDFETAASHQVTIQVKDSANNVFTKTLTISVTDTLETVDGSGRNDRLTGTESGDMLSGFSGNDKIYGLGGDDILNGGAGKDILYGGAGKDTFVFDTKVKKGHFDHIMDFNVTDDTIQVSLSALGSFKVKLSKKDASGAMKGGNDKGGNDKGGKDKGGKDKGGDKVSTFKLDKVLKKGKLDDKFFSLADKAKDTSDLFYYNSKNGFLYIDADGSGTGKGVEIAKLSKGLNLTADDFLFI